MDELPKLVSKEALRRIISDVSTIVKTPLHDNGIYYEHDTENVLKGYVLIIPQNEESPYYLGNYLFSMEFPSNYPYSPPKMTYLTNNGNTRFHPNLYRNGKVCLSLLNTWKGEQWTSCNTLSSVLLNLTTLFTSEPLLHEPGITKYHESFNDYTDLITYENYNTAICQVLTSHVYLGYMSNAAESFKKIIQCEFKKNERIIMEKIKEKMDSGSANMYIDIPFYKMRCKIDYHNLYVKLKEYNN
jgi:ubiquitin-conjugating enzyme E2 Z